MGMLLTLSLTATAQPTVRETPLQVQDTLVQFQPLDLPAELPDSLLQKQLFIQKKPVLAVTNNLLYEAATAFTGFHTVPLAVGLELPLGKHWSLYSDYIITVPWHAWNDNAECVELMHLNLGGRWYPSGKRVLGGWYLYASAGVGYYDFERDGKGYQGEEVLASVGGGYSVAIGEHFRLNLGVGVGPILTRYRYYEGRMKNQHLLYQYNGSWSYFGPTDAQVTLKWLFYHKKKK